MDYTLPYLLSLGFLVGLSGAMLPGPLLVYTINESLHRGRRAGPLIIAGHVIVEVILISLIALGVAQFMESELFIKATSLLGGMVLAGMGVHLWRSGGGLDDDSGFHGNIILGGVLFSAFNPGFPIWWATAGARMLVEGFSQAGLTGVAVIVAGHWMADVGYFSIVSAAVDKGRDKLLTENFVAGFRRILAVTLIVIGMYFLHSVF